MVRLMECRGLVSIADVEVMFVDLQSEMESKSRVACLRRAFRRVAKAFMPQAQLSKAEAQLRVCSISKLDCTVSFVSFTYISR
jgi:hypothetical protein